MSGILRSASPVPGGGGIGPTNPGGFGDFETGTMCSSPDGIVMGSASGRGGGGILAAFDDRTSLRGVPAGAGKTGTVAGTALTVVFFHGGGTATIAPDAHNPAAKSAAPIAKPNAKAPLVFAMVYSVRDAGVPGLTIDASSTASQFVSRIHPCDVVWPIVEGSGVP